MLSSPCVKPSWAILLAMNKEFKPVDLIVPEPKFGSELPHWFLS